MQSDVCPTRLRMRRLIDESHIELGRGGDLILVVSAKTGEMIRRIPRPDGANYYGYARAAAFDRDGKRLAVIHQRSFRVYDVATGQLRYERTMAEKEHLGTANAVGNRWLLGSDDYSLLLGEQQRAEAHIPLGRIDYTVPIPEADRQTLLVETSSGFGGVIGSEGQLLRSWVISQTRSARDSNSPPLSGVAFEGRLVARLTGSPAVELIDAHTLEPIAQIHILKFSGEWGWIVHTPDGYWDSSPGADRYVAVFQNGRPVQLAESKSRRTESLLRTRLPR